MKAMETLCRLKKTKLVDEKRHTQTTIRSTTTLRFCSGGDTAQS